MDRRNWIWAAGAFTLLAGLVALRVLYGPSKATVEHFHQTERGMSAEQVVRILGRPTKEWQQSGYILGPDYFMMTGQDMAGVGPRVQFLTYNWEVEDLNICIQFSPEDKVIYRHHTVFSCYHPPLLEVIWQRLKAWCGR